jgi:hypothetical protein
MNEPIDIEALRPADTPAYMTPAWLGCIHWALGNDEMVAEFREDTGNGYRPPKNAIDAAIDKVTGADRDFLVDFIKWANVNVWGPLDGPPGVSL